ncbi:pilus assembly PilX family protein [Kingella kingae]|nr:pilus assembly protein [Kingella kingae]
MHYVIEYLGVRTDLNSSGTEYDHFRITSRARGQNKDTVVTLQSYVELLR